VICEAKEDVPDSDRMACLLDVLMQMEIGKQAALANERIGSQDIAQGNPENENNTQQRPRGRNKLKLSRIWSNISENTSDVCRMQFHDGLETQKMQREMTNS